MTSSTAQIVARRARSIGAEFVFGVIAPPARAELPLVKMLTATLLTHADGATPAIVNGCP
jgi:hypothetical protein